MPLPGRRRRAHARRRRLLRRHLGPVLQQLLRPAGVQPRLHVPEQLQLRHLGHLGQVRLAQQERQGLPRRAGELDRRGKRVRFGGGAGSDHRVHQGLLVLWGRDGLGRQPGYGQ